MTRRQRHPFVAAAGAARLVEVSLGAVLASAASAKGMWRAPRADAGTLKRPFRHPLLPAILAALVLLVPAQASAAPPGARLVKDINPGPDSSFLREPTVVGDTLFFSARDGESGRELWKSEGNPGRTTLVKDINPEVSQFFTSDSIPEELTAVGDTLFFRATDRRTGRELWKSDGTEAGTVLVKDIGPGSDSSFPRPLHLTAVGDTLFFSADDGNSGTELWKSEAPYDDANTTLVKDINPRGLRSPSGSFPEDLTAIGDTLFFSADDGTSGDELWKSDGTEAGTVLVKDIEVSGSLFGSFPSWLTAVGDTLFFSAEDVTSGQRELWKSDGTEAGTVLVKDINPGPDSSFPAELTAVGNTLFFSAFDGSTGRELWKSDGTEAGTVLVKDITPGSDFFGPNALTAVGNTLFFSADDGERGRELWKSEAPYDDSNTTLVKDINPGPGSSRIFRDLTAVGDTLFFSADDGESGDELWKSDGTEAGTVLVADINPSPLGGGGAGRSHPSGLTAVGDTLFFSADDGKNGRELWKAPPNR